MLLRTNQIKTLVPLLIAALSVAPHLAATQKQGQQITVAEAQEAQEVVQLFTTRFLESKDLAPIVKDLYVSDFMERYKKARAADLDLRNVPDVYFVPGLFYQ